MHLSLNQRLLKTIFAKYYSMSDESEVLKLERQLCFPLYTASRLTTQCYQPILQELGLTYPQYLVMLVLWEKNDLSLSDIAHKLYLQSNTLTPLLKRMEELGLLTRTRSKQDERSICISLTEKGSHLKAQAEQVPSRLMQQVALTKEEAIQLHTLLYRLIRG